MKVPPLKPGEYHWIDRGIFARGQRKGRPRYGCSYTLPRAVAQRYGVSRRRRELAAFSITSARDLLHRRKTQLYQRDYSFLEPPPQAIPTLRDFVARYIDYAKTTKKSWMFDQARLKAFVARHATAPIDAVTPAMLDHYKAARARDVAPKTVNHELQVLRLLFAHAVRWNVITRNPADGVKRLKVPQKVMRVLGDDEEKMLLEAASPHLRDFIVLVLHTGLRRGEALALRGKHVDLDKRMLTVAAGKGDKVRVIPINDTVREILARRVRGNGYVFTWEGNPIKDVKVAWGQALRRSGVAHITIHNLRDTFATRAVHLGVDLVTLMHLLGHTSIEMTSKYTHPTPEASKRAVELMDDVYKKTSQKTYKQ